MVTPTFLPAREKQALREVGSTAVARGTAVATVSIFLLTVFSVGLIEPIADRFGGSSSSRELFGDFGSRVAASVGRVEQDGIFAANRELLDALDEFEDRLEEESFLRRRLLPALQWRMAYHLGVGNEQAYIGREGWLFYRPDVDYVTGPGFLAPDVLRARRRGGDLWREPPEPDPLPALIDLNEQLGVRGVRLVVLPAPVKPSVHPERFVRREVVEQEAIQNPSFAALLARLHEAGIDVVDPAPGLLAAKNRSGEAQFLRTDTHWTPQAVDRFAEMLARRLESTARLSPRPSARYSRRAVILEGFGDVATMLLLPARQDLIPGERLTVNMVLVDGRRSWRPQRDSEILLLGDSFTNVYSDPALGWGSGAGLAEQLSFHLQRPLDKLALNAGGALATRLALRRALERGEDRLSGKKVVIYQFATRELAQGDWEIVPLGR